VVFMFEENIDSTIFIHICIQLKHNRI